MESDITMTHKATYEITRYPGSGLAAKIVYRCACGKTGTLHDGARGLNLKMAKAAYARHAESSTRPTPQDRPVATSEALGIVPGGFFAQLLRVNDHTDNKELRHR